MKKTNEFWYRSPKTTNEKRQYYSAAKYVRAKRRPANLVDTYDDIRINKQNTWKHKRKTQYRCGGRGTKHVIHFSVKDYWNQWKHFHDIKDYFEEHDIPFCLETLRQIIIGRFPIYKRVRTSIAGPAYTYGSSQHQAGWQYYWEDIPTGEYKEYKYSTTVGYRLTYWTDKNLDLSSFV